MKISHPSKRLYVLLVSCLLVSCSVEHIWTSNEKQGTTQRIQSLHLLKFGTVYGQHTFFHGPKGPEGFEYELIKGFSRYLNVDFEILPFSTHTELYDQFKKDRLDIIATGEGMPDSVQLSSSSNLIFGPIYKQIDSMPEQNIGKPLSLRWQLAGNEDNTLQSLLFEYLSIIRENGLLAQLEEKHFGDDQNVDYVDTQSFIDAAQSDLKQLIEQFKVASSELDWRLMAAISYHESKWNPKDISADNANYFSDLSERLPARIPSPDRTWMTLAAYYIGFGHVEDARVLTQREGGNPDIWIDVKKRLPQLQQARFYSQTRYGYANGKQTTEYVENIRRYYDTLVWLDENSWVSGNASF